MKRMLDRMDPDREARLVRRCFVVHHLNNEFVLEEVSYQQDNFDHTVLILHYERHGRPACELRDDERTGYLTHNPNYKRRSDAILCRRCRQLNRI